MDGQSKCGLEGEVTVRGGDANHALWLRQIVRNIDPHIEMGNEVLKEEEE